MKFFALAVIPIVLVALSPRATAINFDWTNASGVDSNWNTPANWNPAGPPQGGGGNFAQFIIGATGPANITADVLPVQDYLFANDGSPGVRIVNHSAGIGDITGWFRTGISGAGDAGTYNMSGGQLNMGSFRLAENAGTSSTLNVTGGTYRQVDVANPADGGTWPRIAGAGNATVNLSGTGVISADARLVMGNGGTVTINQTGGTFEVRRGEYTLGDGYPAGPLPVTPNATHSISAGTLQALSTLDNGDTGGNITVAQWGNANAVLTISGTAIVRANRDILIADVDPAPAAANASARGEIVQTGGTVTYGRGFVAGRARSGANFGDGYYTLSGGTLMQDTVNPDDGINWNHIGQAGTGTFNISGSGIASFNGRTHLGSNAGGVGVVNQTGGLFEVRNHELIIGDTGTGTYNISAGTVQTLAGRPINVGHWNNSFGNLNVSGTGQVLISGDLNLGNGDINPNGTLTQSGGLVRVGGNIGMANVASGTGTYNLNGGTLDMTGGNINRGPGTVAFNFNGGRLLDAANINLDLTQQAGVLAPGPDSGPGTTTVNGTYSLNAPGTLELNIELASFDRLVVTGTVTLAGNLDLIPGAGLTNGQTFLILSNNSVSPIVGTFAGRPDDTQFFENGATWSIDYQAGDGNDVLLTHVVPEPGSAALIVAGLLGGALRRRRQTV